MKKLSLTVIICFFTLVSFAQDSSKTSMAYTKGSSTISAGYGFFNIWRSLLEFGSLATASATGPAVLTYEYGISKRISAGITVGYSKVYENDYGYSAQLISYLFVANGSYHFLTSQKLDPYISAGFGYYHFKLTDNTGDIFKFVLPSSFAISADAGIKAYFSPHFAGYIDAGYVDGAIVQAGLAYKIR